MSISCTNTTTEGGRGAVHILVFPYPAQGHMIPLLDLTHQLAVRGLTITILITPKNLPILKPLLSSSSSSNIQTLVLPFPDHRLIPPGIENVKDLPPSSLRSMIVAMGELYDPLLNWFNSHPSPPIAILSDLFLGWTSRLASHLGIPRIVFSPSPGLSISVIDSLWRDLPKISDGHHSDDDPNNALICFQGIPNSPVFPWCHLSPIYRTYIQGDPDSEFIRDCILANFDSWGIVFNSFRELDSVYQDYMLKKSDNAGDNSGYYDRVWSVGPLLPPDNDDGSTERGGSGSVKTTDLLSWLESCPDHSVVYICFGSQVVLSNEQMEGLAAGLECSQTRFLWCVKEPTEGHLVGDYSMVPVGFEGRTAGRGLVLRGWIPQVLILRHRSIGSFLTQCGSNSMLEGLAAGVLILAWPMGADQFSNAKLLVDTHKAAVRVCEGADTVPDATELGRALAESVSGNRPERVRALEQRKAASNAVKEGGSSFKDLDRLVRDLCGILI